MLFKAVNSILLRNLRSIAKSRHLNADQTAETVSAHIKAMRAQWFTDQPPAIDYEDPLVRWAYVFAHVPVQANLFFRVLIEAGRHCRPFGHKLITTELSMTVLGGGPGTELLGLAKYYLERAKTGEPRPQIRIRVDVIDRVGAWVENVSWTKDEITNVYSQEFGSAHDWPVHFDVLPFPLNFSDLRSFANLPSLFQKDIFVLKLRSFRNIRSQRTVTSYEKDGRGLC